MNSQNSRLIYDKRAEYCDVIVSPGPFAFFRFFSEWATLEAHSFITLMSF